MHGNRRLFTAGLIGAILGGGLLLGSGPVIAEGFGPAPAPPPTPVLVVSQDRILREANAPSAISEREKAATLALQAEIEQQRSALQEEEEELTRLRESLPAAEFEARAADFDSRMRAARRSALDRGSALQARFRAARERLVRYLPPILARIADARGAQLVIDSSSILIASPMIDVTDEVIEALNREIDAAAIDALIPEEAPDPPDPAEPSGPAEPQEAPGSTEAD